MSFKFSIIHNNICALIQIQGFIFSSRGHCINIVYRIISANYNTFYKSFSRHYCYLIINSISGINLYQFFFVELLRFFDVQLKMIKNFQNDFSTVSLFVILNLIKFCFELFPAIIN